MSLKRNKQKAMSETKLGSEPAYPCKEEGIVIGRTSFIYQDDKGVTQSGENNTYGTIDHPGMSKRFYAACCAMQGILSANPQCLYGNISMPVPSEVAKLAYEYADELLSQENL